MAEEQKKLEVVVTNAEQFRQFVMGAAKGDRARYHVGDLTTDRHKDLSHLGGARRLELDDLANEVGKLARIGFVLPAQRREGDVFIYLAIRSSKSWGGEPQREPVTAPVPEFV